jgi:hypothetical protein
MKSLHRAAAVAALLLPLAAAPAAAQNYRGDIGINAGGAFWTPLLRTTDMNTEGSLRWKAGWIAGLHGTAWLTPQIGVRANFAYTDRPIEWSNTGEIWMENTNLYNLTGDLMFRPMGSPALLMGRGAMPYIALGVGGKMVNTAGTTIETPVEGRFIDANAGRFVVGNETVIQGLVALGTDLRLAPSMALRFELGDRIFNPKTYRVGPMGGPVGTEERVGPLVHELYGILGLQFLLGLQPVVVAVTPAPPPPPPPPPPPAAPREETLTICVIDPMAPGGIRQVQAIHIPAQGDTLVVVDGQRRAFRTTLPMVQVAAGADWYVAGRPLVVTTGLRTPTEFVTYGGSRLIDARDLVFLGTVRGMPVYADAADVTTFRTQLETAHGTSRDLEQILRTQTALRQPIADLGVLYVPLNVAGCVFQPLQRLEPVIKGR